MKIVVGVILAFFMCMIVYLSCSLDVPKSHIGVLIRKSGLDVENGDEIAPTANHKGVQLDIKTEKRYILNPYTYDWEVYPMVEIPEDKMGVRIRLYGDDLPYGHFVATNDNQKGVVKEVLRPGRYALNAAVKSMGTIINGRTKQDYVEIIELHSPVTIQAGFRGIVTNLAGPIPEVPNQLLSPEGFRGVQEKSLEPGTYYLNPYMYRVNSLDCRSQRFNLAEGKDMGFPSKDGFWVSLDGIIEFRIKAEEAARVFVIYNEESNGEAVDAEIIQKVILPNARAFCRLRGSNSSGREFIGGETRTNFQNAFQGVLKEACAPQGIDIVQALITKITPPEAIAEPVRRREVAHQKQKQFTQEELQQVQEAKLATEQALVLQKQNLIKADQDVVKVVTGANKDQEVALTFANQQLEVAKKKLEAAKDEAAAVLSAKRAEAAVIHFQNQAEAAGWKKSIEALGSGELFSQYTLYQKLAPAFKTIMGNTADSSFMKIFDFQGNANFQNASKK